MFDVKGKTWFIDPRTLSSELKKASLSSKQRQTFLKRVQRLHSLGSEELENLILALRKLGLPLSRILGVRRRNYEFYFSHEWCRTKHIIGLADAVHMSMFNLGIRVRFPAKALVQYKGGRGIRVRFHQGDFDKPRVVVNRFKTDQRRLRLILHYLRVFPENRPEKEYVKLIKENLVDTFCYQMDQERPEVSKHIPLFPKPTQEALNRRFQSNRPERVRFYKNLLESKSLCAEVSDDLVKEAYEKHRSSLCRDEKDVLQVPFPLLQGLYQYGVEVGKFLEKDYDPFRTKLPNTRATIENSRKKGGARASLSSQISVKKGPLYVGEEEIGSTRVEPFVIGLFGPPGVGKTTTIRQLLSSLHVTLFPEKKGKALAYSRSCSTRFWDGYENQPIVILDDFGQDLNDRSDLVEFEQLVSINRYQLPMASLDEKGRTFTSPIIILTSNMAYGKRIVNGNNQPVVEDEMAVWRRIKLPLLVDRSGKDLSFEFEELTPDISQRARVLHLRSLPKKELGPVEGTQFYRYDLIDEYGSTSRQEYWSNKYTSSQTANHPYRNPHFAMKMIRVGDILSLQESIVERYRHHIFLHQSEFSDGWEQWISHKRFHISQSSIAPFYNVATEDIRVSTEENDVSVSLVFPSFPPVAAPRVTAVAIREPLKVRMITKAEASTKALQPLQRSLFRYLRTKPQFVLTHGCKWNQPEEWDEKLEWIYRIEKEIGKIQERSEENDLWLSGDYTAATDNFPISVTNALVQGMLTGISHEPTRRWVLYETSPHLIKYPGGVIGKQTSGQLMGSLLSFPLLCFLNDFIVKQGGFEEGKYLINGDDVVARGSRESINRWRELAPQVGLSLSLGKNFIDSQFCTVNSQLFWEGRVVHTGKVSLQTRYGKSLSRCFAEMQFYYGTDESLKREFIRRNLLELRRTPRSLDVSIDLGGLALVSQKNSPGLNPERAKKCYLFDYLSKVTRSTPVPGFPYLRLLLYPKGFRSNEEDEDSEDEVLSDLCSSLNLETKESNSSEMDFSDLGRIENVLSDHERLFNQLKSRSLWDYPPLSDVKYGLLYVGKEHVHFVKKRIVRMALEMLIHRISPNWYNEDNVNVALMMYDSQEFVKEDFLLNSDGIEDFSSFWTEEEESRRKYNDLLPDIEPRMARRPLDCIGPKGVIFGEIQVDMIEDIQIASSM